MKEILCPDRSFLDVGEEKKFFQLYAGGEKGNFPDEERNSSVAGQRKRGEDMFFYSPQAKGKPGKGPPAAEKEKVAYSEEEQRKTIWGRGGRPFFYLLGTRGRNKTSIPRPIRTASTKRKEMEKILKEKAELLPKVSCGEEGTRADLPDLPRRERASGAEGGEKER